VTEAI